MAQSKKKYRFSAHKRTKEFLADAEENIIELRKKAKVMHQILDSLPFEFYDLLNGTVNVSSSMNYIHANIPYNPALLKKLNEILDRLGWKERNQWNTTDQVAIFHYWHHKEYKDIEINIDENAKDPRSTCVLVPLAVETRRVVTAYDKICPDGHPELFKKNEDGTLEYIGDNLFPPVSV